jgi:hypothetical protein
MTADASTRAELAIRRAVIAGAAYEPGASPATIPEGDHQQSIVVGVAASGWRGKVCREQCRR